MWSAGAEQPVVVRKVLQWGWSEGAALFSRGHRPTDAIWQREEPVDKAKPFDIPQCRRPNIGSRVNREVHARFWEHAEVKALRVNSPDFVVPRGS